MKNIIFMGPPGSGKGTQSARLCAQYGWKTISTGQLLREEIENKTDMGLQLKGILSSGSLVSDEIVMSLLSNWFELGEHLHAPAVILDGFPRTERQAEMIAQANLPIHQVHYFHVEDDVIIKRLSGRRVHLSSGRTYHILNNPPKNEGFDDITGEVLVQRSDDSPESVAKRLKEYHYHTAPVIEYYKKMSQNPSSNLSFFQYKADIDLHALFDQLLHQVHI